ncbi:hypothetical protein Tco_1044978 [Tanacetum coccineum]|uniref:Uncharacterized protein n=1 Tax=Tanacetum coccineum TaxID=301880 RepID=A0ABQ5GRF6_9ASTR
MMTSLSNKYKRLKEIPEELGLDLTLPLLEQDPPLPKRKRKVIELEHETYIAGLHCNRTLPEEVYDIQKVETEPLLGYKMMVSNVKTAENQWFLVLMNRMIDKRLDKYKLLIKRVKLELLGYTDV